MVGVTPPKVAVTSNTTFRTALTLEAMEKQLDTKKSSGEPYNEKLHSIGCFTKLERKEVSFPDESFCLFRETITNVVRGWPHPFTFGLEIRGRKKFVTSGSLLNGKLHGKIKTEALCCSEDWREDFLYERTVDEYEDGVCKGNLETWKEKLPNSYISYRSFLIPLL